MFLSLVHVFMIIKLIKVCTPQTFCCNHPMIQSHLWGSAVAWWLMPQTPDPEVGGSSPTWVKPCCVLEQGTFTPQKVLVIPRKRWLRPNMTEKLFTGTLTINQPTKVTCILNIFEKVFKDFVASEIWLAKNFCLSG